MIRSLLFKSINANIFYRRFAGLRWYGKVLEKLS